MNPDAAPSRADGTEVHATTAMLDDAGPWSEFLSVDDPDLQALVHAPEAEFR